MRASAGVVILGAGFLPSGAGWDGVPGLTGAGTPANCDRLRTGGAAGASGAVTGVETG